MGATNEEVPRQSLRSTDRRYLCVLRKVLEVCTRKTPRRHQRCSRGLPFPPRVLRPNAFTPRMGTRLPILGKTVRWRLGRYVMMQAEERFRRYRRQAQHIAHLVPTDKSQEQFIRACGEVECELCGLQLYDHPFVKENHLTLRCDGQWCHL